jgi:hypothetical protein
VIAALGGSGAEPRNTRLGALQRLLDGGEIALLLAVHEASKDRQEQPQRSPSPRAACARRCSGLRPPCTATATTASWPRSSPSPATKDSPATSATAATAGPPCTDSTRPASAASPSKTPPPARPCTQSQTKASPSARSPRRAAATSTCQSTRSRPTTPATLRLPLQLHRRRQPRLQHAHPKAARMEAHSARPPRRPRPRPLLPAAASHRDLTSNLRQQDSAADLCPENPNRNQGCVVAARVLSRACRARP